MDVVQVIKPFTKDIDVQVLIVQILNVQVMNVLHACCSGFKFYYKRCSGHMSNRY